MRSAPLPVMICAPAAERPTSVGDEGRKAVSDGRTAQVITTTPNANSESARESRAGTVSRGAAASGGFPETWVSRTNNDREGLCAHRSDRELTE